MSWRFFYPAFSRARFASILILLLAFLPQTLVAEDVLVPVIDGPWWQIAGNPDLGEFTSERQEPVDFGIWQANDGTWQLWSCIRNTKCGGNTRLFYRWEGKSLTQKHWQPQGIAMQADPELGETPGGLQAPHVIRHEGRYLMFYGSWGQICLATSQDGKNFTRHLNADGKAGLFGGPYDNTRDAMTVIIGDVFHCYYTGHKRDEAIQAAVFCRTSRDLQSWSEPIMVSGGGTPATQDRWFGGDAECPFVLRHQGHYYLFRNQRYGPTNLNTQYRSDDPLDFGVDTDRYLVSTLPVAAPEIIEHEGQMYIAALNLNLDGIRIARLKWQTRSREAAK